MPTEWYQYGVTQAHGVNGEKGVDLGTPFHTPLYFPYGGQVVQSGYGPWGGDLKVAVAGQPGTVEELLHDDVIYAQVGDQVRAGQIIALSGGQNVGGFHPATPQFSTGPHTEFDLAIGGQYVDPTPLLSQMQGRGFAAPTPPTPAGTPRTLFTDFNPIDVVIGASAGSASQNVAQQQGVGQGATDWFTRNILNGILRAFGFKDTSDLAQRFLLFLLGLVLLVAGIFMISVYLSARAIKSVGGVQGAVGLAKAVAK